MILRQTYILLAVLFLVSCARLPIKQASDAMRPVTSSPKIKDDLPLKQLLTPLAQHIEYFKQNPNQELEFGPTKIPQRDYILALEALYELLKSQPSKHCFYYFIQKNFQFYEVYGKRKWGEVFITGYYEPVIEGSLKKTKKFSHPIYGKPKDMVYIRVDKYEKTFDDIFHHSIASSKNYIHGRLIEQKNGFSYVIPFYDRKHIEQSQAPIFAWADPIDLFFLQIQGSGTVLLEDPPRKIPLGYLAQNGHPYVPIGKYLFDVIPREEMSLQSITKYLRTLPDKDLQDILNKNPSYIFFKERVGGALSFLDIEVTPQRSIATDPNFFPKGALAFLDFKKPVLKTQTVSSPIPGNPSVDLYLIKTQGELSKVLVDWISSGVKDPSLDKPLVS